MTADGWISQSISAILRRPRRGTADRHHQTDGQSRHPQPERKPTQSWNWWNGFSFYNFTDNPRNFVIDTYSNLQIHHAL
ncbi:MAG: hypothetical protein R2860_17370 [Desulfobacterales bacterium]